MPSCKAATPFPCHVSGGQLEISNEVLPSFPAREVLMEAYWGARHNNPDPAVMKSLHLGCQQKKKPGLTFSPGSNGVMCLPASPARVVAKNTAKIKK